MHTCAFCTCVNVLPVTCSVKVESVGRTQPEPEAEPGAGTFVSSSDSSESNPDMVLRAPKR